MGSQGKAGPCRVLSEMGAGQRGVMGTTGTLRAVPGPTGLRRQICQKHCRARVGSKGLRPRRSRSSSLSAPAGAQGVTGVS